MSYVIYGAGGHGHDIAAAYNHQLGFRGFYDDNDPDGWPQTRPPHAAPYVAGVNDPRARRALCARLDADGWAPSEPLHWLAARHDDGTLLAGPGTVIMPGAVIGPGVTLGRHVHIGAGVTITRAAVGDYTTIAPGATICGDVTIGEACLIGAGAVVTNLHTIGRQVTVGAGAVVVDDLPDEVTVVGVPARPIGEPAATA